MGSTSVVNHVDRTPPPAAPPKPKPAVKVKTPPAPAPPPRLRTVGAVTRAVANYREKREAEESTHLEPNKRVKSAGKSGEYDCLIELVNSLLIQAVVCLPCLL